MYFGTQPSYSTEGGFLWNSSIFALLVLKFYKMFTFLLHRKKNALTNMYIFKLLWFFSAVF